MKDGAGGKLIARIERLKIWIDGVEDVLCLLWCNIEFNGNIADDIVDRLPGLRFLGDICCIAAGIEIDFLAIGHIDGA
ncbi:MAG: hypothetical protein HQL56_12620 [Magnetococcales bacterium]|nr:hypothetical protein [Magnetococcales bacterium]